MSAFDPDQWLRGFEAAGGAYALLSDGRLWMGVLDAGTSVAVPTADIVGHPDRVEAIKVVVRKRCLIG